MDVPSTGKCFTILRYTINHLNSSRRDLSEREARNQNPIHTNRCSDSVVGRTLLQSTIPIPINHDFQDLPRYTFSGSGLRSILLTQDTGRILADASVFISCAMVLSVLQKFEIFRKWCYFRTGHGTYRGNHQVRNELRRILEWHF